MSLLMLFIDGLGIGSDDPVVNPCADPDVRYLAPFDADGCPEGGILVPTDASLGVPGLPQSATGQTALLTGENASKAVGRHLQGFPNQVCRNLLRKKSVLKQVKEMGFKATFANAYRPLFFTLPEEKKWKLSATTVAALAAGLEFRTLEDLKRGNSIYQDFTNHTLIARRFNVPRYGTEEAASILVNLLSQHDFVLYEYFLTDKAGHSMDKDEALTHIRLLDQLLDHLIRQVDMAQHLLILSSDHGNIEDMTVKTHTTHPVMTLVWGKDNQPFSSRIQSLLDITPAVLDYLKK